MSDNGTREVHLVIIGGGPGGYAAAFHAAELGMKVTVVDSDANLGGVCLNRGCIPSKALLHVAKLIYESREASQWGVSFEEPKIDIASLREWKDSVVGRMTGGLGQLSTRRGVEVIRAQASFIDSQTLKLKWVEDSKETRPKFLRFAHAILATGSVPAMPPMFRVDDPRVMDSTDALRLDEVPGSLLVIGGGYIGLEMGTVYAALGTKVTVVEMTAGLLPGADRDLVRPLHARLEKIFEAIYLNTKVESLEAGNRGVSVKMSGDGVPPEQVFDRALVSVGRWPGSKDIGLDTTRVRVDEKGFVIVDVQQRTNDPNIWAIGDVAGEPMLAHKATREGKVAVESIDGQPTAFDNAAIPAVVFTDPEVAWCGLTETAATAKGIEVKVARFPWAASGRAVTIGRPEGMTKLIFDTHTERVLGMGVVGAGAGELIAEGVLAVEMAAVAHDIAGSIHPHPTLSETVMESAEALFGLSTHIYSPKK